MRLYICLLYINTASYLMYKRMVKVGVYQWAPGIGLHRLIEHGFWAI